MHFEERMAEEIKNKNGIVEVISDYVELEKRGDSYFGICPFMIVCQHHFQWALRSRHIIALNVEQEAM